MFFKVLIDTWKGKILLAKIFEDFGQMLELAEWTFDIATKAYKGDIIMESVEEKFFKTDKKINDVEKDIRKKIVEHLSLSQIPDISASLVLMSVAKDSERTGDYCKNLFQLVKMYGKPINNSELVKEIIEVLDKIEVIQSRTRKAFSRSDGNLALENIAAARRVCHRCDELTKVLLDLNLDAREAVLFALSYRFMKRIAAHLANICTTVMRPLPEIDYFDEL